MDDKSTANMAVLAGEIMLRSGAETYRVEDTIKHILDTAGTAETESLVMLTGIIVTIDRPGEGAVTVMRRVHDRGSNMHRIVEVNEISRQYCAGELTAEETWDRLKKIKGKLYTVPMYNLATILVSAGFAPLFGGGVREILASGAVGAVLAVLMTIGKRVRISGFILNIICSAGIAVAAVLLRLWYPFLNMDTVIISGIMPLVPGVAITNAIRDPPGRLYFGRGAGAGGVRDSGGGSHRSRCGDRSDRKLLAGRWSVMTELILVTAGCFLAVSAFAVLVETPRKYILQAGFAGACGGWVYFFSMQRGVDTVPACFLSALVISLMAHLFARIFKAPVTVFLIAGILPTVPGAGMYRAVYYMIADDRAQSSFYLMQTLEIAGVIALAIFIVDAVFRIRIRGRNKADETSK